MKVYLKIPVNALMFCKELQITPSEVEELLADLQNDKMGGSFELDIVRIGSMEKLKRIVSMEGAVKIYSLPGKPKSSLYAGTEYDNNGERLVALIQIDVSEMGQSYLSVYSKEQAFREVIVRNLLDIVSRIK